VSAEPPNAQHPTAEHPTAQHPTAEHPTTEPLTAEPPNAALTEAEVRELAEIPAVEVITRACVMLMSAAAEKLGLAEDGERYRDLDEARRLIEAYAGLFGAAQSNLGVHRQPLRDGLRALQAAFREASPYPDEQGTGPGEKIVG
jgi:hypothetical protein